MKKKNQLSSFDIIVITQELREILVGGFIDKIYQPTNKELLIRFTVPVFGKKLKIAHTCESIDKVTQQIKSSEEINQPQHEDLTNGSRNYQSSKYQQINLVIKIGEYLYTSPKSDALSAHTTVISTKFKQPRAFAMLLRKHLNNGKLIDIYQHEFDRIIVMEIEKSEKFQLIIELFGDGNIILVKDGKIIQPLSTQTWSYRAIKASEPLKFPPSRINPLKLKKEEFCNLITESKKDLVRTLIMDLEIPGIYAEELCYRVKLDKTIKANQVSQKICKKIYENLQSLIYQVKCEPKGFLIYKDETRSELVDFLPIQLKLYDNFYTEKLDDFNSTIIKFFNLKELSLEKSGQITKSAQKGITDLQDRTAHEHARLLRQLAQQKTAIDKFSKEVKFNHAIGEWIYTNYSRCEELLNEIKVLRDKVGPDEIHDHLSNTEDIKELNTHDGYVFLKYPDLDQKEKFAIRLNLRKNVIENANYYYERSKHFKEKLQGAQKALQTTQDLMSKLTDQVKTKKKHETKQKIVKHFWFEKFHWCITSKGNIVVGGRDAKTNDQVVKKHLKDKDRYCHADVSGAASIVVKNNSEEDEISIESLAEACQFAVIFSKAWNAKVGAATAYWVKPDQVSKTPQSGEYLARGAFVIRGKRNYVANLKLLMAVGEIEYQGKYKLMAGPVETIKVFSKSYVILAPGNEKKNVIANELGKLFNVVVDDILTILPSGGFTIVKKVGLKD